MIRRLFFVTLISPFISSPAQAIYDKSVPSGYVAKLLSNGSENYFSEMNLGWYDEQYAELKAKIDPRRSYIVIHNRIPSVPLDLRSPNHFRSSAMNAGLLSLGKLNIGHIMVGWHCEINGRLYEGNTGITGEQENQQRAMAKAGWGLTGLFSIFKDGHVQTPLLTRSVFHEAREKNLPIATMAFEVEPEECGRMLNFLQAFLSSEKQPYRRFGLNADPLKLEGGGCGSFAASVVSTSGTISEFFPYLWRELYANPRAFGFGLSNLPAEIEPFPVPHPAGKSRDVNLYGLLLFRSWNASPGQGISIRVMDPEMLFLVQRTIARYSLNDIYAENKEEGRKIIASPLMQKRILRDDLNKPRRESSEDQETNIDRTFDQTAANADYGARLWLKKMRDKGLRARGFDFNGQPAILLTR